MIKIVCFIMGIILFLINISGIFIPLRNEQIYSEKNIGLRKHITLTEDQLWEKVNSDSTDILSYVKSLNSSVNQGIAHYWRDEDIDKYNLRIPLSENYFLYAASWIYPPTFQKYEFSHYKKAIERGVGLCSQQAIIISEILKEKNINSKIVGLDGHVVATAQVDKMQNQWWVLDSDYGVIIPHNLREIEHNPKLISTYYSQAGYDKNKINILIDIYGANGNRLINGVKEYDSRIKSYFLKYYIESFTYLMKWLLPLFLIIPYIIKINKRWKKAVTDN